MAVVLFLTITTLLQVILPVSIAVVFLFASFRTRTDVVIRAVAFCLFCLFLSCAGYWLAISHWVGRLLFPIAVAVSAYKFFLSRKLPWYRNYGGSQSFRLFLVSGVLLVFLILVARFFLAAIPGKDAVRLELPFEKGRFVVTDGGDGFVSSFANYHFSALAPNDPDVHPALRFAADIERVGESGRSLRGLPGQWLYEYLTWNIQVTSPCDGLVIDARDDEEENIPVLDSRNFGMGNYLVIRMDSGHCVFLLHLKRNSILVKKGARVRTGESIASVGNSGKSRWPHLHIHVILPFDGEDYWWGDAVPFTFGTSRVEKNAMYTVGIKP